MLAPQYIVAALAVAAITGSMLTTYAAPLDGTSGEPPSPPQPQASFADAQDSCPCSRSLTSDHLQLVSLFGAARNQLKDDLTLHVIHLSSFPIASEAALKFSKSNPAAYKAVTDSMKALNNPGKSITRHALRESHSLLVLLHLSPTSHPRRTQDRETRR